MPVQTRGDRSSSSESSASAKIMSEEGSNKRRSPQQLSQVEGKPVTSPQDQATDWPTQVNRESSPILQKRPRRRRSNGSGGYTGSHTPQSRASHSRHGNNNAMNTGNHSIYGSSSKHGGIAATTADHRGLNPKNWITDLDDYIGSITERVYSMYRRAKMTIESLKMMVTLPNITQALLNIVCLNCVFFPCLVFSLVTLPLSMLSSRVILGSFFWSLQRNYLMWKAIYRVLGLTGLVFVSPIIYVYQSLTLFSLTVDLVLFPGIRSVKVTRPVFVTGCARSGTTYCHRVLTANPKSSSSSSSSPNHSSSSSSSSSSSRSSAGMKRNNDDGGSFAIWRLWEILFPSVTIRYLISPFVKAVDRFLAFFDAYALLDGAYDYRLNGDAHEEAILSLHAMCGDFWVECHPIGFFWKSQIEWIGLNTPSDSGGNGSGSPRSSSGESSKKNSERRRGGSALVEAKDEKFWKLHTSFLKQMLQRQIYFTGNSQVVAKSPSLTWCLPQLVEEFPDCKIVLLARNPNDMLKSNFALMNRSWTLMYGEKRVSEIYNGAMKNLIWRRHEQWRRTLEFLKSDNLRNQEANQNDDDDDGEQGDSNDLVVSAPEPRVLVIRYDDLKFNIRAVVEKVFEHCGLALSMELRRWSQTEEHRQRTRKRSHSVKSFAHYKIPVRPVRDAFKEVCEYFLFTQEWK